MKKRSITTNVFSTTVATVVGIGDGMGNANSETWAVNCIENFDNDHLADVEEESANIQIIWEFQRYQKGVGWGAGENFNSGDPGRFSSYDRRIFGNTLQSVDPGVPDGFKVDLGWTVVFHKKVSEYKKGIGYIDQTTISDRFGWYYATSFHSEKWLDYHEHGCDIRRRAWRRVLVQDHVNKDLRPTPM